MLMAFAVPSFAPITDWHVTFCRLASLSPSLLLIISGRMVGVPLVVLTLAAAASAAEASRAVSFLITSVDLTFVEVLGPCLVVG